jgi:hypothetical protein
MKWRMLEYMARLASIHHLDVWSAVLYVGRNAGIDDTGNYQLTGPDGAVTLSWHYQVVRLSAMQAEELVAVGRPALLSLVGQTHIEAPEVLLPQVVAQMRNVSDVEMRGRLLTALVALISQEEMIAMVERLLEEDRLLLDTPFLRRMRAEGALMARRQSILDALRLRFDPPISVYQQLERYLETITDEAQLEKLFAVAVRGENLADFQAAMREK